mmetsp:Transcript_18795/g.45249  ORF Transcript_18795/g.45249 Transcript_18795/m.45249 type:complete len:216 (-) Transcript_18795:103-750(-)
MRLCLRVIDAMLRALFRDSLTSFISCGRLHSLIFLLAMSRETRLVRMLDLNFFRARLTFLEMTSSGSDAISFKSLCISCLCSSVISSRYSTVLRFSRPFASSMSSFCLSILEKMSSSCCFDVRSRPSSRSRSDILLSICARRVSRANHPHCSRNLLTSSGRWRLANAAVASLVVLRVVDSRALCLGDIVMVSLLSRRAICLGRIRTEGSAILTPS